MRSRGRSDRDRSCQRVDTGARVAHGFGNTLRASVHIHRHLTCSFESIRRSRCLPLRAVQRNFHRTARRKFRPSGHGCLRLVSDGGVGRRRRAPATEGGSQWTYSSPMIPAGASRRRFSSELCVARESGNVDTCAAGGHGVRADGASNSGFGALRLSTACRASPPATARSTAARWRRGSGSLVPTARSARDRRRCGRCLRQPGRLVDEGLCAEGAWRVAGPRTLTDPRYRSSSSETEALQASRIAASLSGAIPIGVSPCL